MYLNVAKWDVFIFKISLFQLCYFVFCIRIKIMKNYISQLKYQRWLSNNSNRRLFIKVTLLKNFVLEIKQHEGEYWIKAKSLALQLRICTSASIHSWITNSQLWWIWICFSTKWKHTHLPYLTEEEYIKISSKEFHQKTPSKWSALFFLFCFKFSISKQDNATFHLHVIQLISHFPLHFVCFQ